MGFLVTYSLMLRKTQKKNLTTRLNQKTVMSATKKIPVSEEVWKELQALKKPNQTFNDLLIELLDREKKRKLVRDMKKIEEEEEFVEMTNFI